MPCYTMQTMSVEFKAESRELLIKALKSLGWGFNEAAHSLYLDNGIVLNLHTGRATIASYQQSKLNELKRAYSYQALQRVAQKGRWTILQTDKVKMKGMLRK